MIVNPSQQFSDFKLFVGNMPCDVTSEEIEELFSNFGELVEVHIMSGARSRSGQSSAFVKYSNMESCNAAIGYLNMKGKIRVTDKDLLSVKFAKPQTCTPCLTPNTAPPSGFIFLDGTSTAASTPMTTPVGSPTSLKTTAGTVKVFVGGLPQYVDRDDLIAIFSPFGKVESVHLMNNNRSRSGQACAFINFYRRNDAQAALAALAGKYVVDEQLAPITVRFADNDEPLSKRSRLGSTISGLAGDEVAKRLAEQAATEILLSSLIKA
jgi:RNA recognition motif-containing protein